MSELLEWQIPQRSLEQLQPGLIQLQREYEAGLKAKWPLQNQELAEFGQDARGN